MNQRYLSKARIEQLKQYIESVLPEKRRIVLKKVLNETGIGLDTKVKTINAYRQWLWEKMMNDRQDIKQEVTSLRQINASAYDEKINKIFNEYINNNYAEEWQTIHSIDAEEINRYLNGYVMGFTVQNNVDTLYVDEIINCESLNNLLEAKYSKNNVDKELLKRTEKVKINIDNFFCGIDYNLFIQALLEYQNTKDEIKLHNDLNK